MPVKLTRCFLLLSICSFLFPILCCWPHVYYFFLLTGEMTSILVKKNSLRHVTKSKPSFASDNCTIRKHINFVLEVTEFWMISWSRTWWWIAIYSETNEIYTITGPIYATSGTMYHVKCLARVQKTVSSKCCEHSRHSTFQCKLNLIVMHIFCCNRQCTDIVVHQICPKTRYSTTNIHDNSCSLAKSNFWNHLWLHENSSIVK